MFKNSVSFSALFECCLKEPVSVQYQNTCKLLSNTAASQNARAILSVLQDLPRSSWYHTLTKPVSDTCPHICSEVVQVSVDEMNNISSLKIDPINY
jgi:hypothetical protein